MSQEKLDFDSLRVRGCDGTEEDFLRLRKIHRTCMEEKIKATLGEWDDEFQMNRLRRHFEAFGSTLRFVVKDGEEIATINTHPKDFGPEGEKPFVEQLYVLPELQGKGIGTWLLERFAGEAGMRLSVLREDKNVQKFYEKLGFDPVGEDQWQIHFAKAEKPSARISPKRR